MNTIFLDVSTNAVTDLAGDLARRPDAEVVDVGPGFAVTGLADLVFVLVGKKKVLAKSIVVVVGQPALHTEQLQGVGQTVLKELGLGRLILEVEKETKK